MCSLKSIDYCLDSGVHLNPTITAYHLLHCYLEFGILVPDIENWTEEHLADNPPRLYRIKQLQAMLEAFGISDLIAFRRGTFIEQDNCQ